MYSWHSILFSLIILPVFPSTTGSSSLYIVTVKLYLDAPYSKNESSFNFFHFSTLGIFAILTLVICLFYSLSLLRALVFCNVAELLLFKLVLKKSPKPPFHWWAGLFSHSYIFLAFYTILINWTPFILKLPLCLMLLFYSNLIFQSSWVFLL